MKKSILLISIFLMSTKAFGVTIAANANVTMVANTSANQDRFTVIVDDTSRCPNGVIQFPASATTKEIHDRAFSMLLAAYTAKFKVTIGSYDTTDLCNTGVLVNFVD